MGAKESKNKVEEFQATNSSDEEEARVKERRKKSLAKLNRRQPKIHAQADLLRSPTVPDLNSSDDDERYNRVDGDEGWRGEVNSLEKTLDTLGLEERVARRREQEQEGKGGHRTGPHHHSHHHSREEKGSVLPGLAGGARGRRKDLKFSWDDRGKHEDWGIQKVNIDGFDPEKFRAVNVRRNSRDSSGYGSGAAPVRSFPLADELPGAVTQYDSGEQQLLASLEQELGVH